jgi:hypothetical protein
MVPTALHQPNSLSADMYLTANIVYLYLREKIEHFKWIAVIYLKLDQN